MRSLLGACARPIAPACLVAAALLFPAAGTSAARTASRCPSADTPSAQLPPAASAFITLCLINEERAAAGVHLLSPEETLSRSAHGYSHAIVRSGRFAHTDGAGRTPLDRIWSRVGRLFPWSLVGENLGFGTLASSSAGALVRAWMASPGHRENMLEPSFRDVGIGVAHGTPGNGNGNGGVYVIDFGTPAKGTRLVAARPHAAGIKHRRFAKRRRS